MEYERIATQGHAKEVRRVQWDALGQCVVLELGLGAPDSPDQHTSYLTLEPAAALQLLLLLERTLRAGTGLSEAPGQ